SNIKFLISKENNNGQPNDIIYTSQSDKFKMNELLKFQISSIDLLSDIPLYFWYSISTDANCERVPHNPTKPFIIRQTPKPDSIRISDTFPCINQQILLKADTALINTPGNNSTFMWNGKVEPSNFSIYTVKNTDTLMIFKEERSYPKIGITTGEKLSCSSETTISLNVKEESTIDISTNKFYRYPGDIFATDDTLLNHCHQFGYNITMADGVLSNDYLIDNETTLPKLAKNERALLAKGWDQLDELDKFKTYLWVDIYEKQGNTCKYDTTDATACYARKYYNSETIPSNAIRSEITDVVTNIYPNPFQNELSIFLDGSWAGPVSIKFVDITGREHFSHQFVKPAIDHLETLHTTTLPNGIYIMTVKSNGHTFITHKVVKF
ncbi:MAG: Secretion system C-terminal sorting domain, partial [Bacteroidota bacterium]